MIQKHKFVHIEKIFLLMLLILAIFIAVMPTVNAAYNQDDINVVRNINGLNLGTDPSTWDPAIATWSEGNTQRIIELNITGKGLTGNLDVTGLEKLYYLDCSDNQLTTLKVTENSELYFLICDKNKLTSLDVTKNTKLMVLACSNNQLGSLDVTKNSKLTILTCHENQLSSLNVAANTELETLFCGNNSLSSLDVTGLVKLTELYCNNNQLGSLDITKNSKLTELVCNNNKLASLDVTKLADLTVLYCNNNQLQNLNLATNTKLTELICSNNKLTNLNVTKSVGLTKLICSNNSLTGLDVTGLAGLMVLYCNDNQLQNLNLATNTKLTELVCGNNQLGSLDVTKLTDLTLLYCNDNQLKSLNLEKNTKLIELVCSSNNQLGNLDVTKLTDLTVLYCNDNQLKSLNLEKNTKLTDLICSNNLLENLNLEKNTELIEVYCNDNQLTVLDVTKNTKLRGLVCSNNELTSLSLNTGLVGLICSNNQLTSLDITKNTKLKGLDCSNNQLESLDVTKNTELEDLYAEDQVITLPSSVSNKGQLTIPNPIKYNGQLVTIIDGAKVNGNNIEWSGLAKTNANAEFTFSQSTGLNGDFSGTVIQPWAAGYTITLDANGGVVDPESHSVVFEKKIGNLPTPTRAGYNFVGWFDEEKGGTEYTADTTYKADKDITLFAQWTAKQYAITFNANGGSAYSEEFKVTFDQKVGTLPTSTRTGYTFGGWSDDEGNKYTDDTKYEVDDNLILYAQWTANKYTITFDANEGNVDPESQPIIFDSIIGTLPTPTRTGYTFEGWGDDMEGGMEYTVDTKYEVADNIILYAQWTANEYTIFFDDNGNTTRFESLTVTYDQEVGTLPIPILSGYAFIGWFDALTGGMEYTNETEYKVDGDTTLYSRWNRVNREGTGRAVIVDGITETPTPEEREEPPQNNEPMQNNPPNPGGQESPNPNGGEGQNEPKDSLIPEIIIVLAVVTVVGLAGFGIYQKWKKP